VTATDTHRTIDAVWRIESAKLIAGLTRIVRDVGLAEDLAQDALLAALEQWPKSGVPDNPGAWLMAIGKRRAIDVMRRGPMMDRKHAEIGTTSRRSRKARSRSSPRRSTIRWAMTCCVSCSSRVTRCCPPKRASRSRCVSWAA
jgi:predicted RNA polymerase sigma factor